jgi:energy-coupling factor transporter ATP-binding protein EcfA2
MAEICVDCQKSDIVIFFCVNCDESFCGDCWELERSHRPGKKGADGLPHEKAVKSIVDRLQLAFSPPNDPAALEQIHIEDDDTTWFGISRDENNIPLFEDIGRYASLMAGGSNKRHEARYPQFVSVIGQTGAGKSTLVKMLIERNQSVASQPSVGLFNTPVAGSVQNDGVPTSGDVHLYADPQTYYSESPMFYADCEGLDGGENTPIGVRHRKPIYMDEDDLEPENDNEPSINEAVEFPNRRTQGDKRPIVWANTPETQKREFIVSHLFPRILYAFSDVVVFVLQNAKVFESAVLDKLLGWASSSLEKSLNQPELPHAIVVLNASDVGIDEKEWDIEYATAKLMKTVADAIKRDVSYKKYADYWTSKGEKIETAQDLLECYYSSVSVVRIPRKGRYMLLDEQLGKLYDRIQLKCQVSCNSKKESHSLLPAEEVKIYLTSAFDHYTAHLNEPFNFIKVAARQAVLPLGFGGNIVKVAHAIFKANPPWNAEDIFGDLAKFVASCIYVDYLRSSIRGSILAVFETRYLEFCRYALSKFCSSIWPCQFKLNTQKCINVADNHRKGHQTSSGEMFWRIDKAYDSDFTYASYSGEWERSLRQSLKERTASTGSSVSTRRQAALQLHKGITRKFYRDTGLATSYYSQTVCLCCLQSMPEYFGTCGHILCRICLEERSIAELPRIRVERCPICDISPNRHRGILGSNSGWNFHLKPSAMGIQILSLDSSGIRGIIQVIILQELEDMIGGKIRVQDFFDLITGAGTGGLIAMQLGPNDFKVSKCLDYFTKLLDKGYVPRTSNNSLRRSGTIYKTRPLNRMLKTNMQRWYRRFFGAQFNKEHKGFRGPIKVIVTATAESSDQTSIFTNYNRKSTEAGS